jgi:hypothetical protein
VLELRQRRAEQNAPKRTTAQAPAGALAGVGRRLRPQSPASSGDDGASERPGSKLGTRASGPRAKKTAILVAAALMIATVSVLAFKKPAPPPGAQSDAPAVSLAVSASGEAIEVDDQGNPIDSKGKKLTDSAIGEQGLTADVPLFGPTPMATMEPAPLGAPPSESDEEAEPSGAVDAKQAKSDVADELWPDEAEQAPDRGKKINPSDVPPWGRGKLTTPTVHRLRLDGPGAAIQGAINATGFTVVIPGRKVMESGKPIERRDSRIARVKTRNASSGGQVAFQFKDGVPGYRVRLRKDYVEFLISAAKGSNYSTAPKKSTQPAARKAARDKSAPKNAKKKTTSAKPRDTSSKKKGGNNRG